MEKLVIGLSHLLAILAAVAIAIMVVAVATDVVVRNSTGASLPGMIEVAETGLVVSVFFGLALAGVKGEHVAVTLLTDRFSEAWAKITNILVWALSSAFLIWALYATTLRAIDSTQMREERFGLARWPMYPMRWVIVVGLVALLLVALANLVRSVAGKWPLGPVDEVEAALASHDEIAALSEGNRQFVLISQSDRATANTTVSGGRD